MVWNGLFLSIFNTRNQTMDILNNDRFLTIDQVGEKIALSPSSIYRKIDVNDKQYDPSFPKGYKIGTKAVRWLESEIMQWIFEIVQSQKC